MTNVRKTIGILSIITLVTVGMMGCSESPERGGWDSRYHDHDRAHLYHREFDEHRYGQADFAPVLIDSLANVNGDHQLAAIALKQSGHVRVGLS